MGRWTRWDHHPTHCGDSCGRHWAISLDCGDHHLEHGDATLAAPTPFVGDEALFFLLEFSITSCSPFWPREGADSSNLNNSCA